MSIVTIEDQYGDTIEVDDNCLDGCYVKVVEDETPTELALTDEETRELIEALANAVGTEVPQDAVKASDVPLNEALLRVAAAHKATTRFSYAKGDGHNIEYRTLVPESVRNVGDHVTFTGYDPDRDEVRAYRSDRIKGSVLVAQG